ncbi:MAG: hypothetical protein PVH49_11200, partial [Syntrophobacterales bacterium]
AVTGGRHPLPVPRSWGTGPGAPPDTAGEVATDLPPVTQKRHQQRHRGRLRNNEHLSDLFVHISARLGTA